MSEASHPTFPFTPWSLGLFILYPSPLPAKYKTGCRMSLLFFASHIFCDCSHMDPWREAIETKCLPQRHKHDEKHSGTNIGSIVEYHKHQAIAPLSMCGGDRWGTMNWGVVMMGQGNNTRGHYWLLGWNWKINLMLAEKFVLAFVSRGNVLLLDGIVQSVDKFSISRRSVKSVD